MTKYYELKELESKAPKLFGIPTGTKLDEMFFKVEEEDGKFVKKPLGGIPYLAVMNITGVPDTGKSVFAEQFTVTQAAHGYKVLFVTVESPANFLYTALKQKAQAMGVDFSKVEQNVVVIDASESDELRENTRALIDTMAYAIREKKCTNVVIDSVTGLYEHKEVLARQIVRQIFNFLKKWRQTAILISQKRSSQASESAEAAGGLAVAHIVDGTIVMDKKIIETRWDVNLYGLPIGSVLRTIRIDGCRLTGHDSRTWVFEITESGLIEIIAPLSEYIKKRGRLVEE
ncbi:putative circadian clock protein, KaiC [Ferroglobus placidus DSM 10642]|uniref:Putative circadian clock protein, KaiC n=1 Tax=Ferroglobus placidus (strain DSM 10642 / AEDII12DO) TaxID=589924 RepID=D3RWT7_FERPA|nr:KaiC domain-containing protein [Ferroglobus placidus]ADC64950.1 putative circadian clock protein, KaiC [Ferroglobus placidus DSM 10642]